MSCNCSSTCTSTALPIGIQGETGAQGIFGGFSAEWIFNTTTTPTPSSTHLRFNSATYSSVTEIYVSDTGTGSLNMDLFLDSLSNSANFGYIKIFKKSDSTKFWTGKITSVTDNGADHTLIVTYILANSTFAASDAVVLTFSPAGPQGPDVLYNTTTAVSTSNAAKTILQTYTLPVNQLATNGDMLEITGLYSTNTTTGIQLKSADVRIGGTVCHAKVLDFLMVSGIKYLRVAIKVTRQSATTLFIDVKTSVSNDLYQDVTGGVSFFETGFSVSDLANNTTLIELRGNNTLGTGETITAEQMVVTFSKKS